MDEEKVWYEAGLAFECQECGCCCTGEPGYIWVSEEEILHLADRLGIDFEAFENRFVKKVGRRKSLIELPNGDCIFFDRFQRRCKVYEERPIQCRTWPFWSSNLENLEEWEKISRSCKGCNRGAVVPLEEIQKRKGLRKM
ncbi:MAG: YkgJ family cysteine cluster protein [Planctomycetia bacterium]|nr:YkgJ family cysteine cluster protein [Planctomycetia bacterium]